MLAGCGTLRRAKIAPEGSVGAPPTVRKDVRLTKRPRRLLRTDFRAFWRCRVQLPTQRASAFYLGKTDVLRTSDVFRVEQSSHEKTSQKLPFRARKSGTGAARGASGEQGRAPKRPDRAAKRDKGARSSAIFFLWVRTGLSEREKCASKAQLGRYAPEAPGASSKILDRDIYMPETKHEDTMQTERCSQCEASLIEKLSVGAFVSSQIEPAIALAA